jgi:hypothetical protein
MERQKPIDISNAGPDWNGWTFGPYGNAKSFRLVTPNGEALTAAEIAATRRDALELGFLIGKTRRQESELERLRNWISPEDAATIRAALAIIDSFLPEQIEHGTRFARRAKL